MSRKSGILFHITSLPSSYGIGDLGTAAHQFVDFLTEYNLTYWQLLPLNPTSPTFGNSPYSSDSAFAGNPLMISPQRLHDAQLLPQDALTPPTEFPIDHVDFPAVTEWKMGLLKRAYEAWRTSHQDRSAFERFCKKHQYWLEDYAMFVNLKRQFDDVSWVDWPAPFRDRDPQTLQQWKREHHEAFEYTCFVQYLFFSQWDELKQYCGQKERKLIGDIPIYVNHDSADTWAHPENFKLDEHKRPTFVSGAPPDYFSETGQRWGNPVYDWDKVEEDGFSWWIERMKHNLEIFDIVRLDHFRGFAGYWEIPIEEETAINGKWEKGPGLPLFEALQETLGDLPLIAEDLGMITDDVRELLDTLGFPGMKILLFAFGPDVATNLYTPHNIEKNSIVYTGTHDNNTAKGWFQTEASQEDKHRLFDYLGRHVDDHESHWFLIRLALMSVSHTAIIPLQDVLGLGAEARFNMPGTTENNWSWRATPHHFMDRHPFEHLRHLIHLFNRA